MRKSQATCSAVEALGWMDRTDELTAAELHRRYLKNVYRYVLQRVPCIEEAEDITAEVFTAAIAGLPRFRGECPPYLWLLSIARRRVARARRRGVRRETLASELADEALVSDALWATLAVDEGPEAVVLRAEARRVLGDLVAHLSFDQREALMLHYMEGLPVAEIALVMNRTAQSVYSLLKRARATLYREGRAYFLGDTKEPGQ